MTRFSAFGDLLGSILDRGARLIERPPSAEASASELIGQCDALISSKGEASGVALAADTLARYDALDAGARLAFFRLLAEQFNPPPDAVLAAANAYAAEASPETLHRLFTIAEPPRQELLRRLNMAPGGTGALVRMRADLLGLLREQPELRKIDNDFRHLLGSWFNRGFLVLRPIDWQTPAAILEKIIAYEAVHQIDSWDELRRRVDPPDRRCFAFFHPSMPDEPLIFVEVALTGEIPGSIQKVLAADRPALAPEQATTAVFYSISNCQAGLAGVSFGAFLIKQVARDLAGALPGLKEFVTLSPVPGFVRWLGDEAKTDPDGDGALIRAMLEREGWHAEDSAETARTRVLAQAARYFLSAKRPDGQPPDPVARFHLGNGAELHAIHWMGDVSEKGLAQSAGVMVNYLYRLDRIEANHEAYVTEGTIAASKVVRGLAS